MPGESLYNKYQVRASNPGGLQNSQTATANSLKDALAGVSSLMDIQTQRYKDTNTVNMQEYLQSTMQENGLGADPVDTIAIKKKFGNSIDMGVIDQTIGEQKEQMVSNAIDKANTFASDAFDQSQDVRASGEAYKQSLLDQNMEAAAAEELTREWRTSNQYRAEDIAIANKETLASLDGQLFAAMQNGAGEEATAELTKDLPDNLKLSATLQLRKTFNSVSSMSDDQKVTYEGLLKRDEQYKSHEESIIQNEIDVAQTAVDNIEIVPESAYTAIDTINSTLGGLPDAVDTKTDNNWVKDVGNWVLSVFGNDNLYSEDAANYLEDKVTQLVKRGIDPREALAIAYQGYNDSAAKARTTSTGEALSPQAIDASMERYLGAYDKQQDAIANLSAVKRSALDKKFALNKKHTETMDKTRQGFRKANRTGDSFDAQTYFDKRINGYNTSTISSKSNSKGKVSNSKKKDTAPVTINNVISQAQKNSDAYDQGFVNADPNTFNKDFGKEGYTPTPVDRDKLFPSEKNSNGETVIKDDPAQDVLDSFARGNKAVTDITSNFVSNIKKGTKTSGAEKGANAYVKSLKDKSPAKQRELIQKYTDMGKLTPNVKEILLKKLGLTPSRK